MSSAPRPPVARSLVLQHLATASIVALLVVLYYESRFERSLEAAVHAEEDTQATNSLRGGLYVDSTGVDGAPTPGGRSGDEGAEGAAGDDDEAAAPTDGGADGEGPREERDGSGPAVDAETGSPALDAGGSTGPGSTSGNSSSLSGSQPGGPPAEAPDVGIPSAPLGRTLRSAWAGAPLPPAPTCSAADAAAQAQWFEGQKRARGMFPSACSSSNWMEKLRAADFNALLAARDDGAGGDVALHRTAINIGANKGYLAAEILGLWLPWSPASPAWVKGVMDAIPGSSRWEQAKCGVCRDCQEVLPSVDTHVPAMPPPLRAADRTAALDWLKGRLTMSVHAIEPQPSNVEILRAVATGLGSNPPGSSGGSEGTSSSGGGSSSLSGEPLLVVHQMGMADADSTGQFEERGPGDEGSSLGNTNRGSGALVSVPIRKVDSFMASTVDPQGRYVLDLLHVDTEGYDPAVIQGASATLPFTRILGFEYHSLALWSSTTLQSVVAHLDGVGFTCYLEWDHKLLQLTGGCWAPVYEFRDWSNVLCVNRRDGAWAGSIHAGRWTQEGAGRGQALSAHAWWGWHAFV